MSEIPPYDIAQAAVRLNVTKSWLRDQVTARTVPFTFLGKGRLARFTEAHIKEILDAGEQRPVGANPIGATTRARSRRQGRRAA